MDGTDAMIHAPLGGVRYCERVAKAGSYVEGVVCADVTVLEPVTEDGLPSTGPAGLERIYRLRLTNQRLQNRTAQRRRG